MPPSQRSCVLLLNILEEVLELVETMQLISTDGDDAGLTDHLSHDLPGFVVAASLVLSSRSMPGIAKQKILVPVKYLFLQGIERKFFCQLDCRADRRLDVLTFLIVCSM
jgi:hypothetical protein